jgi:hypothetical protein
MSFDFTTKKKFIINYLILQLKKISLLIIITPTLMQSVHTKATKNQYGDMEITKMKCFLIFWA